MNIITRKANANALRQVENLDVLLFEGEVNAHMFRIKPVEGIDFTGATIVGTFVRSDNQRVQVETGAVVGGNAEITLTAGCYAVPGRYRWTIYMVTADETACIYAACGTVQATQGSGTAGDTEPIIEPAAPDLTPIENRLTAVENSGTQTGYNALLMASRIHTLENTAALYMVLQTGKSPRLLTDQSAMAERIYNACQSSGSIDIYAISDGQGFIHKASPTVTAFSGVWRPMGYVWYSYMVDAETGEATKFPLNYSFNRPDYVISLDDVDSSYVVYVGTSSGPRAYYAIVTKVS